MRLMTLASLMVSVNSWSVRPPSGICIACANEDNMKKRRMMTRSAETQVGAFFSPSFLCSSVFFLLFLLFLFVSDLLEDANVLAVHGLDDAPVRPAPEQPQLRVLMQRHSTDNRPPPAPRCRPPGPRCTPQRRRGGVMPVRGLLLPACAGTARRPPPRAAQGPLAPVCAVSRRFFSSGAPVKESFLRPTLINGHFWVLRRPFALKGGCWRRRRRRRRAGGRAGQP